MILERPNRAQVGVFSLARPSPTGHDAEYLACLLYTSDAADE